jgi:hypothetical protein
VPWIYVLSSATLGIAIVDEYGPAARCPTRLNVPPPIADHKALRKVDLPAMRRIEKKAGFRLPARAIVGIVMRADADFVKAQAGL